MRDAAETLSATLDSLVAQTLPAEDFELVAIDDGSRDATSSILAEARDAAPFEVRVLQGGAGLVPALNLGLSACRAPFIARLDGDDICHPERLAQQLEALRRDSNLDAIGSATRLIESEHTASGMRRYCAWLSAQDSPSKVAGNLFVESPLVHPAVMFRRECVTRLGGYLDRDWPEDYDLWVRMHLAGGRLSNLPGVLLDWRDSSSRLTRTDSRYAPERFFALKAHYLRAWLQHLNVAPDTPLRIWGAGRHGRRWARELRQQGFTLTAFIDVSPKRIATPALGLPVQNADAPGILDPGGDVILACVGTPGARALIRRALARAGRQELRDFLCLA